MPRSRPSAEHEDLDVIARERLVGAGLGLDAAVGVEGEEVAEVVLDPLQPVREQVRLLVRVEVGGRAGPMRRERRCGGSDLVVGQARRRRRRRAR